MGYVNIPEGFNESYCINASNLQGEFIRYIPNFSHGLYEISLNSPAYQNKIVCEKLKDFYVIVKHKNGTNKIKIETQKSLNIGRFEFKDGREEGYVEIISDGSEGLIIADAIKFQRVIDNLSEVPLFKNFTQFK